jgi:hypothetical protein
MSVTVNVSTSVVLVETSKVTESFIVYFPNYFSGGQIITVRDQDGLASTDTPIILSSFNGTVFQPESSELVIDEPYGFFTIQNISTGLFETINSFNIPAEFATANISNLLTNDVLGLTTLTLVDSNIPGTAIVTTSFWVAVGDGGNSIKYSFDGNNWSNSASGQFSSYGSGVAYGNSNFWVAVGNGGSPATNIKYSTDGSNWSNSASGGFTTYGNGVAWNGTMWVAVGSGGNTIKYSYNGSNWSNATGAFSSYGYGVAWNGSRWVAVGDDSGGNSIKYSINGINWSNLISGGFANYGFGVAWNGSMWVAVGDNGMPTGSIKYSYDGSNWNNSAGGFDSYGSAVAWNGSLWIALGSRGFFGFTSNIQYSFNGINWNNIISGNDFLGGGWGVSWIGNQWVAVGDDVNNISYSINGSNWSNAASGAFTTTGYGVVGTNNYSFYISTINQAEGALYSSNDILYLNGEEVGDVNQNKLFSTIDSLGSLGYISSFPFELVNDTLDTYIITGSNISSLNFANIQYSLNGALSWSNGLGTTGFAQYGTALAYSEENDLFIAAGQNNTGSPNLRYLQWSSNGVDWYPSESPSLNNRQTRSAVHYANGLYHAVGSNGNAGGANSILYSTDGINWAPSVGSPFTNGFATGIAYGNGVWVCTGCTPSSSTACALWSSDGSNWSSAASTVWNGIALYDITFTNERFVAICTNGTNSSTSNICFSFDGSNWFSSNAYAANFRNNAVYITGAGDQVAVTTLNTNQKFVYSLDGGDSWNSNTTISIANSQISKPYYDGVKWLASVGNSIRDTWVTVGEGTNTLASSDDGSNWTGYGTSVFSTRGNSVVWNGALFVAVGEGGNSIATSMDGYTWNGLGTSIFTTAGLGIGWNGYEFIAVGSGTNTIAICSDGVNWVGIGNQIGGTPTRGCVAWNGAIWVVGSDGTNKLRLSSEGFNWSNADGTTFTTGCYGIAWNGKLFVAVGEGSNTIAYSSNGSNWSGLGTSIFNTAGNGIAWNGSLWIAVGSGGFTMASSPDGSNWTSIGTSPFTTSGNSIAWNGSRWVATGEGTNVIATSTNGTTWSSIPTGSVYTTSGIGVTYSYPINRNPLWVAGGRGTNSLAVSFDGTNWRGLGTSIFSTQCRGVFWSGYMYVAIGEGTNTIATSLDGISWTGLGNSIFSFSGQSVAWNGSLWVAVGSGTNTMATSPDGTNWSGLGDPFGGVGGTGSAIAWNGELWVAGGNGTNTIIRSSDTIVWGPTTTNPLDGGCVDVAWSGQLGLWVAVGNGINDTIATSTDGDIWTGRGNSILTNPYKVAWNGSLWIAVGTGDNVIVTSVDGINWIGRGKPAGFDGVLGISWSGKQWLALGYGSTSMAVSYDGINWTAVSSKNIFSLYGYTGTYTRINLPPLWIACGDDRGGGPGKIFATSINGSNFTSSSAGQSLTIETNGVAYNGRIWLAGGGSLPNTLIASVDGINWYGRGSYVFNNNCWDIQWNGSLWVAVGESTRLATSPDGIFWTPRTVGWQFPRRLLWDGKKWLSCGFKGTGNSLLEASSDGITWSYVLVPFTNSVEQIAYNGSLYVAAGQGGLNAFATSPDGINWTGRGNPVLTNFVTAIAASSNLFVAVGQGSGNVIASSPDGITWTSRATGALFGNYGYAIGWNGKSWIAMGVPSSPGTTNTMAWSSNGINWNGLGTSNFFGDGRYVGNNFIQPSNPVVQSGLYFSTDLTNWYPTASNSAIGNGGVITAITSRNTFDNINLLYQSSLQGLQTSFTISSINTNFISAETITSRTAFISSLFVTVQNVSTTQEASNITSTLNVDNSVVTFASIGSAYIEYASISFLTASTIQTNVLFASTLNIQNLRLSTLSTSAFTLNSSTISVGSNTGSFSNYGRIDPQGDTVGLGTLAGNFNARSNTIAIGYRAGFSNASTGAIAIGINAGSNTVGEYSIAIGPNAGSNFLSANTIFINASNQGVGSTSNNGFYVNPIRSLLGVDSNIRQLYYNTTDYEIIYGFSDTVSTFSTLFISTAGINGSLANTVNFQVNGSANIEGTGNFRFGVSSVNQGVSIDYNAINVGRRNTEIISGKGAGSKGWIDFYTGVVDNTTANGGNLAFTIANNRVGVNISSPQVTMDINGSLRAFSSITTTDLFVSSINGINIQEQYLLGSNLLLSSLVVEESLIGINPVSLQGLTIATGLNGGGSALSTIKYTYDGSNWSNINSGGFATQGYGIYWNGSLWLAGGDSGAANSNIKYSYDGSNWSNTNSGGFTGITTGFSWNGNIWIAVGSNTALGNTIKYSYDILNWSNITSGGFSYRGDGVTWNGKMWVALGYNNGVYAGTIQYSYNGFNWSNANSGADLFFWGYTAVWNGTMWVATGDPGIYGANASLKYSFNGTTWSDAASGGFNTSGYDLAWNGSIWVAVGDGATNLENIKYSYNGSNWSNAITIGNSFDFATGVTWNGKMWIVTCSNATTPNGNIQYSFNGSNWSNANSGGFIIRGSRLQGALNDNMLDSLSTNSLLTSTRSNSLWVAVGDNGSPGGLKYSYDGMNWSNGMGGSFLNAGNGVYFNGALWVAVGESVAVATTTIKYSYDGSNWNNCASGGFTGMFGAGIGYGVGWNGSLWIAVGDGVAAPNNIQYSYDGSNWNDANSGSFTSAGYSIAWNGSLWVAGGISGSATSNIKYSFDGSNWSNSSSGGLNSGAYSIAWNGSLWVAAGFDSALGNATIQYSSNGSNWNNANSGGFSSGGRGIAWNGSLWVAVGDDGTSLGTIKYSYDGSNWSNSTSGSFLTSGYGISWNGNMWIALGNESSPGSMKYSYDGSNWSNSTSGAFTSKGIAASFGTFTLNSSKILIRRPNKEMWIAVGDDTTLAGSIKHSYNGINWNNSYSGGFTGGGNGIGWNGSMWIAVGNDITPASTIKYSYDGLNWSNSVSGSFGEGAAVAWNGNFWVAVGNGGTTTTIKYSYDGLNWSNINSGGFDTFGYAIAWNGNMWVAGGEGNGGTYVTLKYSYNGSNWSNATNIFSHDCRGVAWNGYMWVATGFEGALGGNTIKYSYNGSNWSNAASGVFTDGDKVAWNGTLWVATGSNASLGLNIRHSYDGINWNSPAGGGSFITGGGVAWNGYMWVAMGNQGAVTSNIKYSYDGSNWSNTTGGFATYGNSVAYSWTVNPDISTSNLDFYLQSQPTYINTKNQVFTTASTIVLNNTLYINRFISSVGVNTAKPDYNLHVVGDMRCSSTLIGGLGILSNTTALATSDSNIKENIQFANLDRCMEIVETVPLKHYRFIPEYQQVMFDKTQIGFLAQDVEQVFPNTTLTLYDDTINRDIKYLSKDQMYMAHFGTTQKLIQFIEVQTSQISSLYSRIDALEKIMSTVNYSA